MNLRGDFLEKTTMLCPASWYDLSNEKNLNRLIEPKQRTFESVYHKLHFGKTRKRGFWIFEKTLVFGIGVSGNLENFFLKNESTREIFLSYLKEKMMGYLPITLSQFWWSWRKMTFLPGWGLKKYTQKQILIIELI